MSHPSIAPERDEPSTGSQAAVPVALHDVSQVYPPHGRTPGAGRFQPAVREEARIAGSKVSLLARGASCEYPRVGSPAAATEPTA